MGRLLKDPLEGTDNTDKPHDRGHLSVHAPDMFPRFLSKDSPEGPDKPDKPDKCPASRGLSGLSGCIMNIFFYFLFFSIWEDF